MTSEMDDWIWILWLALASNIDDQVGYYDLALTSGIRIGWPGLSNAIDRG
jgi:hypothetical protein